MDPVEKKLAQYKRNLFDRVRRVITSDTHNLLTGSPSEYKKT